MIILAVILLSCGDSSKLSRPNIIFIMSDDHAKNAVSCYSEELVNTPNIDRLAREGIRFENAVVTNAICAPSRAVILTGKYSHLNGLRDNRDVFDSNQTTFPALLQKAGYYTAIVGKWHLKSTPGGFDYWKVLPGQGYYYNPVFINQGDTIHTEGYVTDLITDYAIETLDKREKDKPFCLMIHNKAPHRNWMPDLKHLSLFKGKEVPEPENLFDDYNSRSIAARDQDMEIRTMFNGLDMKLKPSDELDSNSGGANNWDPRPAWENTYNRLTEPQKAAWDAHYDSVIASYREADLSGKELIRWKYQRYIKDYLRCIVSVDENIGRVLDYIDQQNLAQNTIVVYTSDQGFFLGEHGWYDKRFMYEESAGMPLIIRYPGEIPAGSISSELVLNLDFPSTFLDYAGAKIPKDMQGQSLRPLLTGSSPPDWREAIYYHYYEYPHGWHDVKRHYGVRTEQYKLIHFYNDIDEWELFDLQKDPSEMNNIYDHPDYIEIVEELKVKLKELQRQYKDDVAK
jgi:arylsulfatase A-like enzyme